MSPVALAYLTDGEISGREDMGSLWCLRHGMPGFFDDDTHPKELWEKYRDEFLPAFIADHPGFRPLPWWAWDSPRQPDHGSKVWWERKLPEPRKRIGGKGELHRAYVPAYQYGIPTHWDSKTLDSNDPLIFESQSAYLLRHNLLTANEKTYLEKHRNLLSFEKLTNW